MLIWTFISVSFSKVDRLKFSRIQLYFLYLAFQRDIFASTFVDGEFKIPLNQCFFKTVVI